MTIVNPEYHTLPLPSGPIEALERIKASFLAGELQAPGECGYTSNGKPCAIASLFSPALCERLKKDGLNSKRITSSEVVGTLGSQVIESLTGMSLYQCDEVQVSFDYSDGGFVLDLDRMIFEHMIRDIKIGDK